MKTLSKKKYQKSGMTQAQYLDQRGLTDANNRGDFNNITPNKARQILHAKEVDGHPLSPDQYKLFGYLSKGNTLKFQDGGDISSMGYRDDSPYKNRESIDIQSPSGLIDMSHTGQTIQATDNTGYSKILQPYSGQHQFPGTTITEKPLNMSKKTPYQVYKAGGSLQDYLMSKIPKKYQQGGILMGNLPKDPNELSVQYPEYITPTMQDGGRLVTQVPMGYLPIKDKPNYYQKTTQQQLAQATGSNNTSPANSPAYMEKMKAMVQQGYPVDSLVSKGYGTKQGLQSLSQFYRPTTDTVYTQPKPVQSFNGQLVYDGNQHATGMYRFQTRNTNDNTQTGQVTDPNVEWQDVDMYGHPKGVTTIIPGSIFTNKMVSGTNMLNNPELLNSYRSQMSKLQDGGYLPLGEEEYKMGGIHINPANKGKFTASAKKAGMGVQAFAKKVLANKDKYSTTQIKRAVFARNFAK